MAPQKRVLTGIRASGQIHIGNYLGAIRPAIARQADNECFLFIADLHALTTNKVAADIRSQTLDVAAAWIACGFDRTKGLIYRQSDIPFHTEAAWYLSCVTGLGLLEKGHSYKDSVAQNRDINHGILAYPVLMAADILLYQADIVPVGKDQKQHVEMARDMAQSFQAIYQPQLPNGSPPIFKLPEPLIQEETMVVPGLDGRKMSKSYGNVIPLFTDDKSLEKLCMSIVTDSTPLEAPKDLDAGFFGAMFRSFATPAQYQDLKTRLAAGGLGWGHAKKEFFALIRDSLKAERQLFRELRGDEGTLNKILDEGGERAFEIAKITLNRMREAVGYSALPYRFAR